jgi:hypothetical protein
MSEFRKVKRSLLASQDKGDKEMHCYPEWTCCIYRVNAQSVLSLFLDADREIEPL